MNEVKQSTFITELSVILSEMGIDSDDLEEMVKKSAFEEWDSIFSAQMPINSISQIRQVRLFFLIKNVFKNKIPSEFQIARIFHITPAAAKTLISNCLASYKNELDNAFSDSVKTLLKDAKEVKNGFMLKIDSSFVVTQMNNLLRLNKPECETIKKLNENTSYFLISKDAKEWFESK